VAKLSNKGLLGIALLLSLVTAALIYNYLRAASEKPVVTEGEIVIVAKADIPPKTQITADMVKEARMPTEYIQPGAMRDMPKVVGVMTREQILTGEQVLDRRLLLEAKQAGFSGLIPKGKRAVTISLTEVTGVSGFLKAGDYVDVYATFDPERVGDNVTQIILQNVAVLAVNQNSDASAPATGQKDNKDVPGSKVLNITLALTPEDAAKVTLTEERGKIRLALRPFIPENGTTAATPLTPTDLVGVHKSPITQSSPDKQPPAGGSSGGGTSGGDSSNAKPPANNLGIPVIRGTKVE